MQVITMGAAHQTPREEQEEFDRYFAFSEGAHAGRLLLAPTLNPYHEDDPLHGEWERGRMGALAEKLQRSMPVARAREPIFVQRWEHEQAPGDPVALTELVAANEDDGELCDWARRAMVDACFMTGGGAAPACWLRRVA